MDRRRQASGGTEGTANRAPRMPVAVTESCSGVPIAVRLDGEWTQVETLVSEARICQNMVAGKQVVRSHYRLRLTTGAEIEVIKNHVTGGWYLAG